MGYIKKNKNWGEATRFIEKHKHLFYVWVNMKTRCFNKNTKDYKNYGGRGISICKEWFDFKTFVYDMKSGYKRGLLLDRKDNDKGYSRENCRWVSRKVQNNNKRIVKRYLFNGKFLTIPEWSILTGVKQSTLYQRLYVYKWDIERLLTKGGNLGTD